MPLADIITAVFLINCQKDSFFLMVYPLPIRGQNRTFKKISYDDEVQKKQSGVKNTFG